MSDGKEPDSGRAILLITMKAVFELGQLERDNTSEVGESLGVVQFTSRLVILLYDDEQT